jgi:D-aspartate ligase
MNTLPVLPDSTSAQPTFTRPVTDDARTPVVILGADADGLGLARCLGRARVPVILVDTDALRPGMHSRYVQPFVMTAMSGPALIDGLLFLRARLNVTPLLFLTTDTQVRTVSEYRHRLAGAFCIRLPERDCIRQLLHKLSFQHTAEKHGFPVPRAIGVSDEEDFVNFSEIRFPAVIKPGNKELYFLSRAPRAQKVRSRDEAETACRAILREAPDLIVQEWVEGGESDIYFCLQYRGQDGRPIASFTGRKLRCWPPQTGSTASCTAALEMRTVLESMTKEFFDKMQLVGMCSMEFKRDRRNGKFFMIEPTVGRADWQEEVAAMHGVDIPLAAYRYELGLPLPSSAKPCSPLIWMYPPSYVRSIFCAQSSCGRRPRARGTKTPCWNLNDPVPSAFFLLEWIRKLWSLARWRELICQRHQLKGAESVILAQAKPEPASCTDANCSYVLRSSRRSIRRSIK